MSRLFLVWRKFGIQPFSQGTVKVILVLAVLYLSTFLEPEYTASKLSAMLAIVLRSAFLCVAFAILILKLDVSPEIRALFETAKKRLPYVNGK
jgi:hypothetical protein